MRSTDTTNELADALSQAQAEFPMIPRSREVKVKSDKGATYTFNYAPLDVIRAYVQPVLAKHRLAVSQGVVGERLHTRLMHGSGQWLEDEMPLPFRDKPQVYGSELTYKRRYAFCSILGISTEEDDDANGAEGNHYDARDRRSARPASALPEEPPFSSVEHAAWIAGMVASMRDAAAAKDRTLCERLRDQAKARCTIIGDTDGYAAIVAAMKGTQGAAA